MSLVFGTKLGPFEILAPVDAGGMSEVYGAELDRGANEEMNRR